jgi:hypothetical protein
LGYKIVVVDNQQLKNDNNTTLTPTKNPSRSRCI